jgi:uncharacterized protein YndB with AHSA1/START domain
MSSKPDLATEPSFAGEPNLANKPSLTIKRRLNAPPPAVYRAWTDPAQITRWFGPEGAAILRAEADARVGGRFHIVFRTAGGEEHGISGVYRDVVLDQKLVFTWAWRTMPERESLVTIALKRDGEGTLLTLIHEQFFDEPARDRHRNGWTATLDKLERLFAKKGANSE